MAVRAGLTALFCLCFMLSAFAPLLPSNGIWSLPMVHAEGENPTVTAESFLTLLVKEDFVTAQNYWFSADGVSAGELRQEWTSWVRSFGSFEAQAGVMKIPTSPGYVVTIHVYFAKEAADMVVGVTSSGKINFLSLTPKGFLTTAAYTPPAYSHSARFNEQAVTVGRAPWALPGTLTMPDGPGPFPAIVLMAGSGPEDRDGSFYGNKPFRDIAWGLASQGIAVLRYDKRTRVYHAQIAQLHDFTVQNEFIDDAKLAVQLLVHTPRIAAHRIYLLGHSEGGMVAPRIAQQDSQIAGMVILAGPTRSLGAVAVSQDTFLLSKGLIGPTTLTDAETAAHAIAQLTSADRSRNVRFFGEPPAYWLDLQSYRPAIVAQTLKIPMLILQGARDYQVTLVDFDSWKAALATHANVSFKLYPNLYHAFLPVPPGSPAGLSTPSAFLSLGHIDPQVIHDIARWVKGTNAL